MRVLRRIDINHREELYEKLKRFVEHIKRVFPIERVYLFGSFAKGKVHEGSDIDLAIIGEIKGRFHERSFQILDQNKDCLPIEPLCYTVKEFEEMARCKNPLICHIMRDGIEI